MRPHFLHPALVVAAAITMAPRAAGAAAPRDEAHDDDDPGSVGMGAESDVKSRFIWRGAAWSRGPVLQSSVSASAIGLTGDVWCSYPIERQWRSQPSAVVASVTRDFAWRALRIEPGFVVYDLPRAARARSTSEASLDVGIELGDLRFVTTHALDVGTRPRAYFGTAGVGYEREIARFTFTIAADVGWASAELNRDYFRRAVPAVDVAQLAIAARYELTDVLYVVLHAEGSTLVAPVLRRNAAEPTLASVGATLGFEL